MSLSFTHLPTHWNADEAYTHGEFVLAINRLKCHPYSETFSGSQKPGVC